MRNRELLIEIGVTALVVWWFFFVSTNVNPTLGTIYTGLVTFGVIAGVVDIMFDKKNILLYNSRNSWFTVLLAGVIGYIILMAAGQLSITLAKFTPVSSILKLLGASAPVFSNSPIINYISFAFMIAFIETYAFFGAGLDLIASIFNVKLDNNSLYKMGTWIIIFVISLAFLLFHVTAKGLGNDSALLLVFFMAVISCFLTVKYQDMRPAIIMHILANGIASLGFFT